MMLPSSAIRSRSRLSACARLAIVAAACVFAAADQLDLAGPAGSGSFGDNVTVLPNGNIVVTDPDYDLGDLSDAGAVYLYSPLGNLISTVTGSRGNDQVGLGGVVIVGSGNFVILSPYWSANTGAVTWASGSTGLTGTVSAANSLTGTTTSDTFGGNVGGRNPVTVLPNGNYVVRAPGWGGSYKGAVAWGSGTTGTSGVVSAANAFVGSSANDEVGKEPIDILANGNYAIRSPKWDNGSIQDAGTVTWASGTGGSAGIISAANSLVGSTASDQVGFKDDYRPGLVPLKNGHYIVISHYWNRSGIAKAGAMTWCDGNGGTKGPVSTTNSIPGTATEDFFSWVTVTELTNGNFVFAAASWDSGAAANAGAARWCPGSNPSTGAISSANSLVGNAAQALIGYNGTVPLSNGNYVVVSNYWHNGSAVNAGAVTWGNGSTGVKGVVSSSNSLVGTEAHTNIGCGGVTALANGHYVVCSPYVSVEGRVSAGAATWCSGITGRTGRTGTITKANSLTGAKAGDAIGQNGAVALANSNYVVVSSFASNGNIVAAGAVTWCPGINGRPNQTVTIANSLMGSHFSDSVGFPTVAALSNGNYLVGSFSWDDGAKADAGALTWGDGTKGITGIVSAQNSLIGASTNDRVGSELPVELTDGNYAAVNTMWSNGSATEAGAITWGNGRTGISGVISPANSLTGSSASDRLGYDSVHALPGGGYLVRSSGWDAAAAANAGAITRIPAGGLTGAVSTDNSLVGGTANEALGREKPDIYADGACVISSPRWKNGTTTTGAIALMSPGRVTAGGLSGDTGITGTQASYYLISSYDAERGHLVVGQSNLRRVSIFSYQSLLTAADKFASWTTAAGLSGDSADPQAIPHGDGVPNLLKYAFGLDPAAPDSLLLPEGGNAGLPRFTVAASGGETDDGIFRLEYVRRKDSGLLYEPRTSPDLITYQPMQGTPAVSEINGDWERVVIEEAIPEGNPSRFGVIRVTLP